MYIFAEMIAAVYLLLNPDVKGTVRMRVSNKHIEFVKRDAGTGTFYPIFILNLS